MANERRERARLALDVLLGRVDIVHITERSSGTSPSDYDDRVGYLVSPSYDHVSEFLADNEELLASYATRSVHVYEGGA